MLTGRRHPLGWTSGGEAVDFYDVKGVLEDLLGHMGVRGARWEAAPDRPWLHPGRAASLSVGDVELGWAGQIHPDRLDAYEIPSATYAFEVDLEAAGRAGSEPGKFTGLDRFPSVERDVAVLVDRRVSAREVFDAIASLESPLIRSAVLFDAFEGGRLPEGKVSLAIRLTYRSDERTLTEEEVSRVEQQLLQRLGQRTGARLRDT